MKKVMGFTQNPRSGRAGAIRFDPAATLEIGTVLVLNDVRFERSSSALDARFQPDLEQLARTMLRFEVRIRIAGHTDGEGVLSAINSSARNAPDRRNFLKHMESRPIEWKPLAMACHSPSPRMTLPRDARAPAHGIEIIQ